MGPYRVTLAPIHNEYMGFTLQGHFLSETPFNGRDAIRQEFQAVLQADGPRYSDLPVETKAASYEHAKRALAPMSQRGDVADMILGAVVYGLPTKVAQVQFHPRDR
jgi:hypothetical protein